MNVNYEDLEPIVLNALKQGKTANERIDNLPLPMVFKGSLGTGGTISTLPTASSENEGFVYIVITDGTYAGQSAKAGDLFVSDGTSWVLVPSADEPSVIDDSVTSTALTWSSSKLSGMVVKSFTYTGDGQNTKTISFPIKPTFILSISGQGLATYIVSILPFNYGVHSIASTVSDTGVAPVMRQIDVTYNDNEITLSGNVGNICNTNNKEYTVYYI